MLKGNLTAMLGVKYTNVLILNVKDHSDDMIDVYLVIRGLGRYLVEQRIRQTTYLQRIFRIHSVSPNLCKINKADVDICPSNTFCFTTRLVNSVKTNLVDTNRSSLVALDVMDVADCVCSDYFDLSSKRQRQQCVSSGGWCRNGGSCKDDGYGGFMCECPFGFEGPRCESLERTFAKNGFAKFKALDSCQPSRLHLEFSSLSEAKAGLLLLNGDPFMDQESDKFFIAIQIVNGSVLVHLGRNTMVQLGDDMVDGNWHHVDIEQVGEIAKVTLDQCESSVVHVNLLSRNLAQNDSDIGENQDNALYLGGLPQRLRVQDVFRHVLAVHEFEGCLRNVMINGQFLDLFIPQNLEGLQHKDSYAGQCPCRHHIYCDVSLMPRALVPSVPWWIWILILAVIFIMTASLSVTLLSFIRRRNDMFLKRCYSAIDKGDDLDSDDHGLRENLISYGEGAGEQDQTSFDINILKKPIDLKTVARQSPKVHEDKSDNGTDSFIPYAYEGENNSCAASELSSITYSSEQLAPLLHQPLHCNHRNTLEKLAELFDPGSDGDSDSCRSSSLCCISQPIVQQANLKNHVSRQMCNGNTTFSPTSSVHFESDI
ncbi:hypothetical protein GJ496_010504 [Pomphorhynchus laevis]|nr:hypothetical protein GJ496_010504 [Pomphorhynchus laevis]